MTTRLILYEQARGYFCEEAGCHRQVEVARLSLPIPAGRYFCFPHLVAHLNNGDIALDPPESVAYEGQPTVAIHLLEIGKSLPCIVDGHGKNTLNVLDGRPTCSDHLRERFGNPLRIVDSTAPVPTDVTDSPYEVAWE